ncbi:MAG: naringenin-chalcone synthase [Deltaproteobacteria bacterium]|nr:MAG: naringenin-chalcone synthase [Deltaproteobacteria bacterium]
MSSKPLLTRFAITRPAYEIDQAAGLQWLAAAHAEAEAARAGAGFDKAAFTDKIARVIERCACPPSKIGRRGHSVRDITSGAAWSDNELYDLPLHPHGSGSATRTRLYAEIVDRYFAEAYAGETQPPDDLIHVTCTGYASPSGGQKLVAARGWPTRVTHAYHMGCYAAVPAVRLAAGALATAARRVDIVHTELCSLHLDPTDHRLEQLVVQSLFADGMIRYAMVPDHGGPGLRVLALHEQLLPDTTDAMGWLVANWGMQMTLSREVPDRIAGAIRGFVIDLYRRAGLDLGAMERSVFAVHPGGPKIIDRVREVLELSEAQVEISRAVLFDHGNMSSATLPHIWQRMLDDRAIARGALIPSLAFGPGLTMCGALLEKR